MASNINASDLQSMISHWLATPPNGYLGSGYGAPTNDMLQTPMRTGLADAYLTKLRIDVPLAGALPPGALNVFYLDRGPDRREFYIDAAGEPIAMGVR